MPTSIWWIRRDLRLTDNQALHAALESASEVLPVFVLDPKLLNSAYASEKRTAFLFAGLQALDESLRQRGSRLIMRQGDPQEQLRLLCQETNASLICAERDYSPYATQRDQQIAQSLGVPFSLTEGVTIRPLHAALKADGSPYVVFTPFSRAWKSHEAISRSLLVPAPEAINTPAHIASLPIPNSQIAPESLPFLAGEAEAKRRIAEFVTGEDAPIFNYGETRNRPDLDGTSQLSPYLRFGMISSRLAALAAYEALSRATYRTKRESADIWLNELIWREFYLSILDHFPHVRQGSFRPEYDAIQWVNHEGEFAAWCAGQTGYPFIDAAMRQLKETGWMHNRARMAVASFLVKDLLIDWRWGERWFMQQLIDGDPAANNGGWQWTAGVGTDAAPYFRIFNPISQGTRFDSDGTYVRCWVPELSNVPTQFIHEPWIMPKSEQVRARCLIGSDYPLPIVDHSFARERVLAAYKAVKG